MAQGPHSVVIPDTTYVTIPASPGLDADDALPWLIDVDVFEQGVSQTNWDTITVDAASLLNGWKESSGAQNAELAFDVILAAGTWDIELLYTKNSNNGIYSVQLGAVEQGTVDGYAAAVSYNNQTTLSGISIAESAKYRLTLVMATKHASASNYVGEIVHLQLRRTA